MSRRTSTSVIAFFIIALIILLAVAGYLFYDRTQLNAKLTSLEQEMIQAERVQTELQIEYEEAIASLDDMRNNNKELEALIDQQKEELKSQKNRINNLIWKENKLKEAQEEIRHIKEMAEQYIADINNLKAQNEALASANVQLTEERDMLSTEVIKVKETAEELMSQNEELETVKEELSKKVDLASVIKAGSVEVTGYKQKSNGEFASRNAARNIDKLEVCFITERNLVAEKGEEVFYVRIIDPIGETLAIESMGSGVFVNEGTGQATRFTTSGTMQYDNSAMRGCVGWLPGTGFQKGNYKIEIYNKGYLSASHDFTLK